MHIDAFAQWLRGQDRSETTITGYGQDLARFARWFTQSTGRACEPTEVSPEDVKAYRSWLQTVQKRSPGTINRHLAALRAWCTWAVESGMVEYSAAGRVRPVERTPTAPRSLDGKALGQLRREFEKAAHTARTDPARRQARRNLAIFQLLIGTGMRVGELVQLDVGDVDAGERSGQVQIRHGKGNKARTVPLHRDVRQALREWLAVRGNQPGPLFTGRAGEALQADGVQRLIGQQARRAGVSCTPHQLRHTFAKQLMDHAAGLGEVSILLGHAKLETTLIYTRPSERDLQRAVERLED